MKIMVNLSIHQKYVGQTLDIHLVTYSAFTHRECNKNRTCALSNLFIIIVHTQSATNHLPIMLPAGLRTTAFVLCVALPKMEQGAWSVYRKRNHENSFSNLGTKKSQTLSFSLSFSWSYIANLGQSEWERFEDFSVFTFLLIWPLSLTKWAITSSIYSHMSKTKKSKDTL